MKMQSGGSPQSDKPTRSLFRRAMSFYLYKTSPFLHPLPQIYTANLYGMHLLQQTQQHKDGEGGGAKMLGRMLRFMAINNDSYAVVDCGCDMAKILPQQQMTTFTVPENPAGLPSVMQLISETRAIAAINSQCLVLVNNPRHWIALIALLSTASTGEDLELVVQGLERKMRIVERYQRDVQVLKTCFSLLKQQQDNVEEKTPLYLESIELQPAMLTLAGENGPFLMLLGESETVLVHTVNAQRIRDSDNDTFTVNRQIVGGLWIVVRRAAGKRELFRVFIHTALCAANTTMEYTLQDCIIAAASQEDDDADGTVLLQAKHVLGQFKLLVRFTEPPPPETEENEEEINEAEMRLLAKSICDDEMLAWSLQYEEEAAFGEGRYSPRLSVNAREQHKRSLHELPISYYTIAAVGSTKNCGARERAICMVCQFPFRIGDELRTLPCFHQFHPACCDPWFLHKPTCPLCQTKIYSNNNNNNEPFEQD